MAHSKLALLAFVDSALLAYAAVVVVVVVVAVAFAGLTGWFLFRRRGQLASLRPCPVGASVPTAEQLRELSDYWEVPKLQSDDRRTRPRRDGNITPVEWVGPKGGEPMRGMVFDRHSDGLHLGLTRVPATGEYLRVRAVGAPPGTPWSDVVVCWTKEVKQYQVHVGCQFSQPQAWNVLLLFG